MKNLFRFAHQILKGYRIPYAFSYLMQLLMVVGTVFSSFLSRVLVDALRHDIVANDPITYATVYLLSGGRGEEYIYEHLEVLPIALCVAAIYVMGCNIIRMLLRFTVTSGVDRQAKNLLYDHLVNLPFEEYKKTKSGDLIQCCTRDIDIIRRFLGMELGQMMYTFFIFITCSTVLATISWKLFLVGVALFPFLFIYSFFLIKKVRQRYRATDDAEADVMDAISRNLNAIRTVKAYGAESKEVESFVKTNDIYEAKFTSWRRLSSFFFASSDIFIFLSRTLSVVYALFLVFLGEITPGTAVIAYTFVNMMVWPLRDTATRISNLGQTLASSDRIHRFLSIPLEDVDSGETAVYGDIEFDHVSFSYPDAPEVPVLIDVSFRICVGQTMAIMGRTGSGKSSIAALLMRLYEPTSGRILMKGVDIRRYSKRSLRKLFAPVLQDPFLFSKSIEDNIGIASSLEPSAQMEVISEYAKVAQIEATILAMPEGYKTAVGEKGVTLSGGQRQRIALARALASQRRILILDDSLSAVDSQTDLEIRKGLRMQAKGMTIIITHRINSAKDADSILVLSKGKVLEEGTHEELLNQEGFYHDLALMQGAVLDAEGGEA